VTFNPSCWVVTDGKAGMESQCIGLAETLGLKPEIKRVRLRKLWRELSPYLLFGKRMAVSRKGDPLQPPWPDLVIGTGRLSIVPSLYIKEMTKGRSVHVQIQNPVLPTDLFDAVIVPQHDRLEGKNVISMIGALHRVTPELLAGEAAKWAPRFAHLPRPWVAVLLGGSNGAYRLDPKVIMELAPRITNMIKQEGGSLLITSSRRTGEANTVLLSNLVHDCPHFMWDGPMNGNMGDNPYYGMLGLADAILVTADSINMVSEACRTGKPVHVIKLPGHSEKFALFQQSLLDRNCIRFFDTALEKWDYTPLAEMERVAGLVRQVAERRLSASTLT
jgi:mitochondrial fission protein ELM1